MNPLVNNFYNWEKAYYKVPKRESPDEWAERVIFLPEGASSIPGRLSLDWCPYLRQPLRDIVDPDVQEITLCWPTQTGKTLGGIILNFFSAAVLKRPVLHVMPTQAAAEGICVERYQPILEASPELWRLVDHRKRKEMTVDQIRVGGIWIDFCGSKSPTDLSSRAKAVLNLDEVDKYDAWAGSEADPVELAVERTRTYWDRKIWKTSTPTTENKYIWRELLASTNERYNLPCPECGEYQELVWGSREKGTGGLKWPADCRDPEVIMDEQSAHYECRNCGHHIVDADKYDMSMRGVWAPVGTRVSEEGEVMEPPKSKRRRGYQLWAIYSPWLTMSEIAVKFLDCFRNGRPVSAKLMNFTNSWRALPWLETKLELKEDRIKQCERPYQQGTLPVGADYLLVTADVQSEGSKTYLYYVLRAWGTLGKSWLIRFGRLDGWEALAELFRGTYIRADGLQLKPQFCIIDSGYRTDEVYQFCLKTSSWALKGSGQVSYHQRQSVMQVGGEEVALLTIGTDYYKDKLHRVIRDQENWAIPMDCPQEYFDHMVAEQKVQIVDKRTGRVKFVWRCVPEGAPNHAFDAECYQMAAAELLQLETRQPAAEEVKPEPKIIKGDVF